MHKFVTVHEYIFFRLCEYVFFRLKLGELNYVTADENRDFRKSCHRFRLKSRIICFLRLVTTSTLSVC